jgi:antitoxin MazE
MDIHVYLILQRQINMQVSRWGNSLAVRLPAALVKELGLAAGDDVKITVEQVAAHSDALTTEREAALARIKATRWTLPKDWKFDREEANAR